MFSVFSPVTFFVQISGPFLFSFLLLFVFEPSSIVWSCSSFIFLGNCSFATSYRLSKNNCSASPIVSMMPIDILFWFSFSSVELVCMMTLFAIVMFGLTRIRALPLPFSDFPLLPLNPRDVFCCMIHRRGEKFVNCLSFIVSASSSWSH